MAGYLQAVAGVLMAVVVCLLLGKYSADLTIALSLVVSAMALITAIRYLEPVLEMLEKLRSYVALDTGYMTALFKAAGVGLIGEIAALVCADGGSAALGKTIDVLTAAVVLWLCAPLVASLFELILKLTGEL